MGGTGFDIGHSITVDNFGNVYTTGQFHGTVDFDPSGNTYNLTSNGAADVYIQKLDANGNFIWAKSIGGTETEASTTIVLDSLGNVYTTGYFHETVDFDPSANTYNLTSNGSNDIYIQKLDSNGNFIWVKRIGGTYIEHSKGMVIDDHGNILITGCFAGTVDFDPNAGTYNIIRPSSSCCLNIFILKLDSNGNFIWAKSLAGTNVSCGTSIDVDGFGNVYSTGHFRGTVDFDPNLGVSNLTPVNSTGIFILKLDSNGNFIWAKGMGGHTYDVGYSITVDTAGNVLTTGDFEGTVDFNPNSGIFNLTAVGLTNFFIQKLDSNGNFLWAKRIGGPNGNYGKSIVVDKANNIYTTGCFSGLADFDPNIGVYNLIANSDKDFYILKLDPNGNFIWAKSMGGAGWDWGTSMFVDGANNIYTTGSFELLVDFNPDAGTSNLTAMGSYDVFIQKLSNCIPSVDVINSCSSYTWIDGITYTANNNTATYPMVNNPGCDTFITLNLTIDTIDLNVIVNGASLTANASGVSYQWLDCRNNYAIIPGATAQNYTPTASGGYAVEITKIGCADTSACIIHTSTISVKNISPFFEKISIYPNPFSELVTINLGELPEVSVKVFSPNGQLLYQKENINTSTHEFKFNQAAGIYFLEVSSQGKNQYFKLVKK
jgi:hypothetical protein